MGELEDRISGVLNDPRQMEQIMAMARSLMGGGGGGAPSEGDLASLLGGAAAGGGAPEAPLLSRLGGLLKGGGDGERKALLEALKPWLSARRREKLERAVRMAQLARVATAVLGETGGEGRV